ncbi:MAG TPA: FAD-dependent oxidoreductase [Geminicoccaceae bacterium]|nr:FAD-dependent oxidoreductase [Geminicoccaceae bacterium]
MPLIFFYPDASMIEASIIEVWNEAEEPMTNELPVAVIGAGPVGLAAAAHLAGRGLTPLIFERGPSVAHALRAWGHVRVFSPWAYNVDEAARALLEPTGWRAPDPEALPTGAEIVRGYLEPLAAHPAIAPHLVLGAEVTAIGRDGFDKLTTAGRDKAPFLIRWRDGHGGEHRARASAVIDASGTWFAPNPMGADGAPVRGEREAADRIAYGIPDVLGAERPAYAGARVLVVGAGHSATNVVLDLLRLHEAAPGTEVIWALRRDRIEKLLGGGLNDRLPARGALGLAAARAIEEERLQLLAPFAAERIERAAKGLRVTARLGGRPYELAVDRIVVATGFRPDLDTLREVRVSLDPVLEAPPALAPLIDPNVHSCGTVPPHGAAELAHPEEPGLYVVGAKSYGRAPTFLMVTGYEQVRSVVALIAGDHAAARDVRLVLPETGVCSGVPVAAGATAIATAGCCGGPAPAGADACCVRDAEAKAAGEDGCGCGGPARRSPVPAPPQVTPAACCAMGV